MAAFSGAFPVAFLETHLNKHNIYSIYNTKNARERAGISRTSHDVYEKTDFSRNVACLVNVYFCMQIIVQEFSFNLLITFLS